MANFKQAEAAGWIGLVALAGLATAARAEAIDALPVGAHPPALETPHFPDRMHAFIWRNWQLVEPERLAAVLRTTPERVTDVARSMGLPPAAGVLPDMRQRGYITLVRRNWHLLPYDQLLELLGMTEDELAFALQEDDFLFIKLGSLKPNCPPLRYVEPSEEAAARAAAIASVVREHFGDQLAEPAEPRFAFVERFSAPPAGQVPGDPQRIRDGLRLAYSYFGTFGDPLQDQQLDPYPDGLLARLAEVGVNGVWLHVVLRQLAPGGDEFPESEFGDGHEQRLENLARIVERARRHGIGVYLYVNEPRAMPARFFASRPEMAGARTGDQVAMCTSDPRVQRWLRESLSHVFRRVPDLAGVFTITASENLTNCWSHFNGHQCPRCGPRGEAEVVAEVNELIVRGVHDARPQARVLVWDWGWNRHGTAPDTIARLPQNVWLMSVSEWAKPIVRGGVATEVGEYAISAVGPGPRATTHWTLARHAGLATAAKVQLNTTWELSAVPYLPVFDLVAEHCHELAQRDVDGLMLSWTLGGYPSPNLRIAQLVADDPGRRPDEVLEQLAVERYGEAAAGDARRAWRTFSDAFREFPLHVTVLYRGPQQMGPANLLHDRPTGYASTMVGLPYDDVEGWRGPYPAEVLADQFARLAAGWSKGLDHLRRAGERVGEEHREAFASDWSVAEAAQLHFASVANQVRFVRARDALAAGQLAPAERLRLREELDRLLDDEIRLARRLFQLARHDSRLGFEASNHYYYVPLDLIEKVISCEHLRP